MPQPVYHIASPTGGGYTMHGYRAGLADETGMGQYPRPDGLYEALRRMPGGRLLVTVWGVPGWYVGNDPTRGGSDVLDAFGAVHVTFAADKGDMMRWLLAPQRRGYTLMPGRAPQVQTTGGDSLTVLFVAEIGGYNFQQVNSVTFWVSPS